MKNSAFTEQLGEYFNTFLPDIKKASPNTISSYADSFAIFFEFAYEVKGVEHTAITYKKLTPALFDEYALWLRSTREYSDASICQRMAAIVSFLKYASRRNVTALSAYTSAVALERPTPAKTAFPYFSLEEMKLLLSAPDPNKYLGGRDLVLLSLMYETGARAQEVCDLYVGSVRFGRTTKVKLVGKRGKVREVPVSGDVAALLKWYLKQESMNGDEKKLTSLFSSQSHDKMTTSCVRGIVDKYVAICREQNPKLFAENSYSPHSFRHSKAVHMAEAGISLIYIRNFLGHASISSTEIYARVGQEAVTKALTERKLPKTVGSVPQTKAKHVPLPDFINAVR